ncbi:MAG: hypothetical protein ACLGH4_02775 [Actinomycetes bacterium]
MTAQALRRLALLTMVGALLTPVSAHAAEGAETFEDTLPCTGELYRFTVGGYHDSGGERVGDDSYHEGSAFAVALTGEPVNGAAPSYSGRVTYLHTANDGGAGAGHAVSTFLMLVVLRGSDGSVLRARTVAHVTATARPDLDEAAVVRRFFEHSTCATAGRP